MREHQLLSIRQTCPEAAAPLTSAGPAREKWARAAAWALALALLLTAYVGTWTFKVSLGIVRPCANMAYFYYSESDLVDRALYVLYKPCEGLMPFGATHHRDRVFPRLEDMAE